MEGPVTRFIGSQVKGRTRPRLNHQHIFAGLLGRGLAIDHFKKHAVQMNGVGHHCIIDQLYADTFIPRKADRRIVYGVVHLAIEGPHIAFHIAREV